MIRPIFVFSIPRGGSTLLQRVLASHAEVATVSEPWLLLPLFYSLREHGARAEYWHQSAAQAIDDFCRELPAGRADYLEAVHDLAIDLYARASADGSRYFVDKTPHYHFIANEVIDAFPEGRFIFLWRNPLSVLASCIETFRDGRWQPYFFTADVVAGVRNLVDAWERNRARAHAVRYEDLVRGGDEPWREVFAYLELSFEPELLSRFTEVPLRGRYGDPTGTRYRTLSAEPLQKWTGTLSGPVRKAWCRRYLRDLGERRLRAMGYDLPDLLRELDGVPSRGHSVTTDLASMAGSWIRQSAKTRALRVAETPRPRGPAFRPPPSLPARARARLRRRAPR
jgi:hypothetical protein